MIGEPKMDMGSSKTPEAENEEEKEMDKMYGTSHAELQMRVVSITSKSEAVLLKEEIKSIEIDEKLTESGKDDLLNDMEALWKI